MPTKTRPCRTAKHHGPEGRTESKICVSRGRNVPSEISYKKESCCLLPAAACRSCLLLAAACSCLLLAVAGCCWLLLAAAGCLTPAAAGCCCWCCYWWLLLLWCCCRAAAIKQPPKQETTAAAAAAAVPTKTRPCRTGKHHGPEGRTESKICVSRGRNVPSEISYKKESCCLLPAAACRSCLLLAAACSCLLLAVAGCCWLLLAA